MVLRYTTDDICIICYDYEVLHMNYQKIINALMN